MINQKTKVISVTLIGTVFQWLEFASYGYIASIVALIYFPAHAKLAAIFGIITLLLSAHIMQPVGAFIFGYIGDRYSRKTALYLSIFLMGSASFIMCLIPGYALIGISAPILFMLCRLTQSFAIAGELNGALIFAAETSHRRYLNLISCTAASAAGLGLLIGILLTKLITHSSWLSWGWRIPLLLTAISCIICSYLRLFFTESKKSSSQNNHYPNPFSLLFKKYKLQFWQALIISSFIVIYLNVCITFYYSFLIQYINFSTQQALWLVMFGSITLLVLLPVIGFASDRIGRSIIFLGLIGALIMPMLMYLIARLESILIIACIEFFFAFISACAIAPLLAMQLQLFPISIRYSALTIAWSLSLSVFTTATPIVAKDLFSITHLDYAPSFYAIISAIITLLAVILQTTKEIQTKTTS